MIPPDLLDGPLRPAHPGMAVVTSVVLHRWQGFDVIDVETREVLCRCVVQSISKDGKVAIGVKYHCETLDVELATAPPGIAPTEDSNGPDV
ncbi:hypothetical protein LCGC14_1917450 [marine sediment metagenome]|uniref:Uncharacterized protein n=1 Tax=marine sediment metagenome TaxID=412755 RepID=A0A0F9FRK8_9ZZZZ